MTAALQDGHIRVTNSFDETPYSLLIAWDWAEGALVVTETRAVEGGDAPQRGDVVETLAGMGIDDLVAKKRPEISAATTGWLNRRLLVELRRRATDLPVAVGLRDPQGRKRVVVVTPV